MIFWPTMSLKTRLNSAHKSASDALNLLSEENCKIKCKFAENQRHSLKRGGSRKRKQFAAAAVGGQTAPSGGELQNCRIISDENESKMLGLAGENQPPEHTLEFVLTVNTDLR